MKVKMKTMPEASQPRSPVFTKGFGVLTIAAVCALCVLVLLGSWQVRRLYWKEALIARVETKIVSEPVTLENLPPITLAIRGMQNDPEYQPITVRGVFDHRTEYFYYATLDGKPGFHVYSPLKLSIDHDFAGKVVFVNRGFIPTDKKPIATRPQSVTSGEITLTGLFRWPDDEKPNRFIPDNDLKAGIFFWRDLSLMREEAGLKRDDVLPFFLYAQKDVAEGLPIGGVTIVDFPNSHLSYAITWYGLALTLIGVYGALLIGRVKENRHAHA